MENDYLDSFVYSSQISIYLYQLEPKTSFQFIVKKHFHG